MLIYVSAGKESKSQIVLPLAGGGAGGATTLDDDVAFPASPREGGGGNVGLEVAVVLSRGGNGKASGVCGRGERRRYEFKIFASWNYCELEILGKTKFVLLFRLSNLTISPTPPSSVPPPSVEHHPHYHQHTQYPQSLYLCV
jgi:hypothetical protein